MKFIIPFLFITSAFCNPTKAEDITYEFLVHTGETTGICDHVPIFKKIFETIKVRTLLEFGLGYSTKYFLDSCTKVISVEFLVASSTSYWMETCLNLYRNYSNWVPVAYFSGFKGDFSWPSYKYFGSEAFYKAEAYFCATHESYATIDNSYQNELRSLVSNIAKYNKIDVALVDPSICMRAEIVQILFDKIPVILSTDTTTSYIGYNPYGFASLKVPEEFEQIHIRIGGGVTVWIKKTEELASLIQLLKECTP